MIRRKFAGLIARKNFWPGLIAVILLVAFLSACTKGGPSKNVSSSAFDSAPADVKQSWNDGIAAWKNHRFVAAATNFVALQSKSTTLSPEQTDALTKAVGEFGQEAFEAANKGDAAATEAVNLMRGAGRRPGTSR
jgi:hypothetical protein